MLIFYEVFAGRAMVTDAGRANSFKRKLKAAWLQKNEWTSEKEFQRKTVSRFQSKKKHTSSLDQTARHTHGR